MKETLSTDREELHKIKEDREEYIEVCKFLYTETFNWNIQQKLSTEIFSGINYLTFHKTFQE